MRTLLMMVVLAGLLAGVSVQSAAADQPSYLILRGPTVAHPHPATVGHYPGYGYPGYGYAVEPQAYSYGWFGARPVRQWTRHNGYYRNYTEWSAR